MSKYFDNESNKYFARKFRNVSQNDVELLESFLDFLADELDSEIELPYKLAYEFLGIDEEKVQNGELEMLQEWKDAVNA